MPRLIRIKPGALACQENKCKMMADYIQGVKQRVLMQIDFTAAEEV